jgi:hypothetical protein
MNRISRAIYELLPSISRWPVGNDWTEADQNDIRTLVKNVIFYADWSRSKPRDSERVSLAESLTESLEFDIPNFQKSPFSTFLDPMFEAG